MSGQQPDCLCGQVCVGQMCTHCRRNPAVGYRFPCEASKRTAYQKRVDGSAVHVPDPVERAMMEAPWPFEA